MGEGAEQIGFIGCRRGGIGRRARLKILFPYGSVGSTPSAGTNKIRGLGGFDWRLVSLS